MLIKNLLRISEGAKHIHHEPIRNMHAGDP